jgi:hypothetical protein
MRVSGEYTDTDNWALIARIMYDDEHSTDDSNEYMRVKGIQIIHLFGMIIAVYSKKRRDPCYTLSGIITRDPAEGLL